MKVKKKPSWLKVKWKVGENFADLKQLVRNKRLHTVCEEARCPNISECWERRTATIMILGDVCTRKCGFCSVKTGRPPVLDKEEPKRVAEAVHYMGLRHAVITSVNRDELEDGGASIWAETIYEVRKLNPHTTIEVLIPDFQGNEQALLTVCEAKPDVLAHNIETVPRLYPTVRPQANYHQSLWVLRRAKQEGLVTKTSIMVGLGEKKEEVLSVMRDAREAGVDIFTVGQYLQPTPENLPVARFVPPEEFEFYQKEGLAMGFRYVASGPLVRSSYLADKQVEEAFEI